MAENAIAQEGMSRETFWSAREPPAASGGSQAEAFRIEWKSSECRCENVGFVVLRTSLQRRVRQMLLERQASTRSRVSNGFLQSSFSISCTHSLSSTASMPPGHS